MAATYNDTESSRETTMQDLYYQLGLLLDRLDYGLMTDLAKRLKVNIEAGTLPAVTTVTTVSTVSNVADVTRFGNMQAYRFAEAMLDAAFNQGIVSHLSF